MVLWYALFFFLLLNAGLLISLIALSFLCGFDYSRVKRFYRLSGYYFLSSLVLTAAWVWVHLKVTGEPWKDFDTYKVLIWMPIIPIGTALLSVVFGLLFAISSRRSI